MDFFKINGRSLHSPKDISESYDILDKIERTLDGTMVVDIIGNKIKIDVSWDYLSNKDMMILKEELFKNTFVTVTFHSPDTGELQTIEARTRDFNYQPSYDWTRSKLIWKSVSVSFEEK